MSPKTFEYLATVSSEKTLGQVLIELKIPISEETVQLFWLARSNISQAILDQLKMMENSK